MYNQAGRFLFQDFSKKEGHREWSDFFMEFEALDALTG
jgi:hypothetical protein